MGSSREPPTRVRAGRWERASRRVGEGTAAPCKSLPWRRPPGPGPGTDKQGARSLRAAGPGSSECAGAGAGRRCSSPGGRGGRSGGGEPTARRSPLGHSRPWAGDRDPGRGLWSSEGARGSCREFAGLHEVTATWSAVAATGAPSRVTGGQSRGRGRGRRGRGKRQSWLGARVEAGRPQPLLQGSCVGPRLPGPGLPSARS